jgi:ATP-dependent helicase/DNAse subunit B
MEESKEKQDSSGTSDTAEVSKTPATGEAVAESTAVTEQKNPLLRLSVSAMKTYESCRRKYYYQYIKKVQRKQDWEHLKVGNFVHKVLEMFHLKLKDESLDLTHGPAVMKEMCSKYWAEFALSQEQVDTAKKMLKQYLAQMSQLGMPKVLAAEKKFYLMIDSDISMVGVIDRVDEDGETYHLVDYKTGKSKYLDEVQLMVYALAMFKEKPEASVFVASYLCLAEDCKYITYKFTKTDTEKLIEKIKLVAKNIREDKTWEPTPTPLCKYCDFAQICAACPAKFRPSNSDGLVQIGGDKTVEWI